MENNIIINLSYIFYNADIKNYIKCYIKKIKGSKDPILKEISKIENDKYKLIFLKKLPLFLSSFLKIKNINYEEHIIKNNGMIEINTTQNINNYNLKCCSFLKQNDQNIIMTSIINIDKFPFILSSVLKTYIKNTFENERKEENDILINLN